MDNAVIVSILGKDSELNAKLSDVVRTSLASAGIVFSLIDDSTFYCTLEKDAQQEPGETQATGSVEADSEVASDSEAEPEVSTEVSPGKIEVEVEVELPVAAPAPIAGVADSNYSEPDLTAIAATAAASPEPQHDCDPENAPTEPVQATPFKKCTIQNLSMNVQVETVIDRSFAETTLYCKNIQLDPGILRFTFGGFTFVMTPEREACCFRGVIRPMGEDYSVSTHIRVAEVEGTSDKLVIGSDCVDSFKM